MSLQLFFTETNILSSKCCVMLWNSYCLSSSGHSLYYFNFLEVLIREWAKKKCYMFGILIKKYSFVILYICYSRTKYCVYSGIVKETQMCNCYDYETSCIERNNIEINYIDLFGLLYFLFFC